MSESKVQKVSEDCELTRGIFAEAIRSGCDVVGFAPVGRFAQGPRGFRPQDYMKNASGVISMGMRIPNGVCDVWGEHTTSGKSIGPYLFYGYGLINLELSRVALRMTNGLEDPDNSCRVFPPTWSIALYRSMGSKDGEFSADLSQRHAAVAAGNAEFGWSGLALNPLFGARMRWNAIITDAPLEPSPMYEGPPVCQPDRCGHLCVKVCPAKALPLETAKSGEIGGKAFKYASIDVVRCSYGVGGLVKGSGSYGGVEIPEGPGDPGHLERAKREQHPADKMMREPSPGIIAGNHCGRCLHQCPAHRWAKRLDGKPKEHRRAGLDDGEFA